MNALEKKLAGMPERLARFYLTWLPVIERAIAEYFPRCSSDAFVDGVTGLERGLPLDHAVISDTSSSRGFRQSIPWIVWNSPGSFPALPKRPMMRPSSSIM